MESWVLHYRPYAGPSPSHFQRALGQKETSHSAVTVVKTFVVAGSSREAVGRGATQGLVHHHFHRIEHRLTEYLPWLDFVASLPSGGSAVRHLVAVVVASSYATYHAQEFRTNHAGEHGENTPGGPYAPCATAAVEVAMRNLEYVATNTASGGSTGFAIFALADGPELAERIAGVGSVVLQVPQHFHLQRHPYCLRPCFPSRPYPDLATPVLMLNWEVNAVQPPASAAFVQPAVAVAVAVAAAAAGFV